MGQTASSPSSEYVEIRELGRGAFGVVTLVAPAVPASSLPSPERYALKKINFGVFSPSTQEAVRKEVTILASLRHPNVVGIRRVWVEKGIFTSTACVLMDYCRHGSTRAFAPFDSAPLRRATVAECRKFALDVLSGLVHLHSLGVVHRDIKLCNILMDDEVTTAATTDTTMQRFRIADFGISVALKAPASDRVAVPSRADEATIRRATAATRKGVAEAIAKTVAKTACGTMLYMAPEMFVGSKTYGSEVDVYAAGVALREMLEGQPVFKIPGFNLQHQVHTGVSTLPGVPRLTECGIMAVFAGCVITNLIYPFWSSATLVSYTVGFTVALIDGPGSIGYHSLRLLSAAMTAPATSRPSAATCRRLLTWLPPYWPQAALVLASLLGSFVRGLFPVAPQDMP